MATQTPNMNLQLPTIGVDSGLFWEQSINANSGTLDQHNHSVGSGAQIDSSGISLTADLPINGNNITLVRSVRFSEQTAVSNASDLGCIYLLNDGNLYFNDGVGNPPIQITAGGAVNATSSGISSGAATASFVASVLVVNQAANTPGNIQGGSIRIGNNSAASKFTTLSAYPALAADYTITLPSATPTGSPAYFTSDASGNGSWSYLDHATLTSSGGVIQVASFGIETANLDNGVVTTAKLATGAVTNGKMATDSVSSGNIIAGNVTSSKIQSDVSLAGSSVQAGGKYVSVSHASAATATGMGTLRGTVQANGTISAGEGFTVSHGSTGSYQINFSASYGAAPTFIGMALADNAGATVTGVSDTTAHSIVQTYNAAGTLTNNGFSFIVIGPQ